VGSVGIVADVHRSYLQSPFEYQPFTVSTNGLA
jgi:hypothetical protein